MNAEKKLRMENNKLDREFTRENREIVTDLVVYIQDKNLPAYTVQVLRREIMGMALESQLRKEPLTEVFGEDYRQFCDELVANAPKKTVYEQWLDRIEILATALVTVLVVLLFLQFMGEDGQNPWTAVTHFRLTGVAIVNGFFLLLTTFAVYEAIIRTAFQTGTGKKKAVVTVGSLLVGYIALAVLLQLPVFAFLKAFAIAGNFLIFVLPALLVLLVTKGLYARYINGQIQ